jgi:hypothetical protein
MVPLVLLFISVLSYALLIPWLGFYWDDWPGVWVSHSLGTAGLREYVSASRPFEGWLFSFTTSLLGESPLHWHIVALLTRWLSALAVWWTLRGLWPQRKREVASIAFLFAVYPGFTAQPIAWITSQGYFIPLTLFVFSLGAMIFALRLSRFFWSLTAIALLSSALSMMVVEHFVGLELLRPLLLWLIISEQTASARKRLRSTLTNWFPYLVVLAIYLIWRLLVFRPTIPFLDQSVFFDSLATHPLSWIKGRAYKAFTDVIESSLMAWGQTFQPDIFALNSRSMWAAWGLVLVSALVVILYLRRLASNTETKFSPTTGAEKRWTRQAITIGLLAICFGGLPLWFANRQVHLGDNSNRYTLSMMFGACIFLVGLIHSILRSRFQQMALVSMVIGLAIGFHFRNADRFRKDWSTQQSLFWQLSWRVPGLQPDTSILIDEPPLLLSNDYALAAPVNFLYAPKHSSTQLNYWTFNLSKDLGKKIPQLAEDVQLKRQANTLSFAGSTSNSLVAWFAPPGCLRILDPERDEIVRLSPLTRVAQPLSNLDRIVTNPSSQARPPADIFGPEPEHCWCYYFEKADLARQMGNWQEVAQLGDEANRSGLKPGDLTELLLFVEAYANTGRYDDARKAAESASQDITTRPALCSLLTRLDDTGPQKDSAHRAFIEALNAPLSCRGMLKRSSENGFQSSNLHPRSHAEPSD